MANTILPELPENHVALVTAVVLLVVPGENYCLPGRTENPAGFATVIGLGWLPPALCPESPHKDSSSRMFV